MTYLRAATPFEKGQFDRRDGVQLRDCPYPRGSKSYRQWLRGWQNPDEVASDP